MKVLPALKVPLTFILFTTLLIFAHSQLECEQSRLQKIQTGQIILNPNNLGAAGSSKNYIESLSRAAFVSSDVLGHAVALAGFQTSCSQTHYSLIVDIVEPQNQNTKLKIVIDFKQKDGNRLTSWSKVKLSYIVVSAQRRPSGVPNAYIWATSQYVDLSTAVSAKPIFTDPLFTSTTNAADDFTRGQGCGLIYDTANRRYKFGIRCDETTRNNGQVTKDVAIHAYIMGFQYVPDANRNGLFLGATTKWNSWMTAATQRELAFYADGTANDRTSANYGVAFKYDVAAGGPVFTIENFSGELQGIKIAIVMSVINPSFGPNAARNGFESTNLGYSYSGLYTVVDPNKFNIKTIIDNDMAQGWNNLHERLPANKYMIYGLSSFQLKDGSGCTSFSIDASINSVSTYTLSLNQAQFVENVVIQADIYFPPTAAVCSPGTEFSSVGYTYNSPNLVPTTELTSAMSGLNSNLKYIKTKSSESYSEVPSDQSFKTASKITDSPLQLAFVSVSNPGVVENVKFSAQVNLTGLTDGKSYGFNLLLVPQTTRADGEFPDPSSGQTYDFDVTFNGFRLFKKSYKGAELEPLADKPASIADWQQYKYGMNVKGTVGKLSIEIVVPRDSSTSPGQRHTFRIIMNIFEFSSVYDPVAQCCVPKCPPETGLDVSVTPVACVVCDSSRGLAYDPSTASCKCADGNYINDNLGFQCFPCQTKLCSTCTPAKPTVCSSCITGASLNIFDRTCACSSGFFERNGTCRRCPARCATCTISSTCDTCADTNRNINSNCSCVTGFFDARIDKCAACNPSCVSCVNATSCSSCDSRSFRTLQSGLCVCRAGHFELIFENGTRVCQICSQECKTCSQSATQCKSCDDAINRIQGYDSLGHKTCICKAGYRALTDGSCIQSNCKSDKWCSDCQADFSLCIKCQATAKRVLKTPQHICICEDGFYEAQDGTCKPCASGCARCQSATKCGICVPQATLNTNGTCTCANGLFYGVASNGVMLCQSCSKYCTKCTDSTACQGCNNGFRLAADNKCICPRNFFINLKDECVPCKVGCEVCNSNSTCSKCIAPLVLENSSCIQKCSQGFFLEGGRCVGCPANCTACTSNNKCFYCQEPTFLYGGACYNDCPSGTIPNRLTFECVACNSPCKTCVNHPSSCTSCEPGDGYLQFTGNSSSCVKECAEGTFPRNGVCEVCDFKCAKCLGLATNCIACPTNTYLYNGACSDYCPGIMSNGACVNSCPVGYFKINDRECRQCSSECSTCDSNSTCLTCSNNLLSLNGRCVRNCTEGFYTFRGICVACDRSCKSCRNLPTQCVECADGFINANGRCLKSCAQNTYIDMVSRSFRQCHPSCKTCSSELNCLTCPNEKIIPIGGQCLSCIYPCANCSSDLSQCFSCQSGFYLSNGDCVRNCPGSTRPVNGICSCSSGLFLDGSCVANCPSGFTRAANECRRCDSPCVECSGSTNFCTDCLDTFTLVRNTGKCVQSSTCNYGQTQIQSGKCQKICGSGFFLNNGLCIFRRCPDRFKDNGFGGCISSSISNSRCQVPTFKNNNACVEGCPNGTFANIDSRTCDSCASRCQLCLNRDFCLQCANGSVTIEGRCVLQARCTPPQVSDSGKCVNLCQVGSYASEGRCVRRCPAGSFFWNGLCYSTCPIEAPLFTDNACVIVCPQGSVNIDGVCETLAI